MKSIIPILILSLSGCQTTNKSSYSNKSIESCGSAINNAVYATAEDISADTAERSARESFHQQYKIPDDVLAFYAPRLINVCKSEEGFVASYGVRGSDIQSFIDRLDTYAKDSTNKEPIDFLKSYGSIGLYAKRLKAVMAYYKSVSINLDASDFSAFLKKYNDAVRSTTISIDSDSESAKRIATILASEGYSIVSTDSVAKVHVSSSHQLLPSNDTQSVRFVVLDSRTELWTKNALINKHTFSVKGSGLDETSALRNAEVESAKYFQTKIMKNLFGPSEVDHE